MRTDSPSESQESAACESDRGPDKALNQIEIVPHTPDFHILITTSFCMPSRWRRCWCWCGSDDYEGSKGIDSVFLSVDVAAFEYRKALEFPTIFYLTVSQWVSHVVPVTPCIPIEFSVPSSVWRTCPRLAAMALEYLLVSSTIQTTISQISTGVHG